MEKDKQNQEVSPASGIGLTLDDLVRRGAREVIRQAIEAELAELLANCANVTTLKGKRAVVRNGYLPEREILTAAGPVAVQVPKVRDRSGSGIKFNSHIVPPYVRKSLRVSAALNRPGFCGGFLVKEGHHLKPVWRLASSIVPQLLPEGYTRWVRGDAGG